MSSESAKLPSAAPRLGRIAADVETQLLKQLGALPTDARRCRNRADA
jgi:hypothetical protein